VVVADLSKLFAIASWIALFSSLSNGLGKATYLIPEEQREKVANVRTVHGCNASSYSHQQQAFLASQILLLAGLCLSKISVISLIQRIFTNDFSKCGLVTACMLGLTVIWGVGSMIAISANCTPDHIFEGVDVNSCPSEVRFMSLAPTPFVAI
jgi:hypothetical protein